MRIGIHVAHALVSIQQNELLQCEEFPLSFCLSQVLMTIGFVKQRKELKKKLLFSVCINSSYEEAL